MEDYKLKVVLAVLSAVAFSMIFIILALVIPVKDDPQSFVKKEKAKNRLEEISRSIKGN
jgi:hypothetical protein